MSMNPFNNVPFNRDGFPGSCWDCLYWRQGVDFFDEPSGDCRRNAPLAISDARLEFYKLSQDEELLENDEFQNEIITSSWPRTHHDDWCGQFAPRLTTQRRRDEEDSV